MKQFFLYCWLLLAPGSYLYSQDIQHDLNVNIARNEFKAKQVIPPGPEASSLGQYGNLPMNLFTGVPNIHIPLYELKGNSLTLPLSLSFNTTGFKPAETASWIGLNWSLNAGGVISRSVMGNPDTQDNYYQNDSMLPIPPFNDRFALFDYHTDLRKGIKDAQPDYYYYNFMNYTGKYQIRPNGIVLKKTKNDLAFTHNGGGDASITDENGNVYIFTDTENTRMVLSDDAEPDGPSVLNYTFPSAWFLSSVTAADGNERLTFEYYTTTAEQPVFQNSRKNESVTYTTYTRGNISNSATESYTATPPEIHIQRKYLKRINLIRGGQTIAYIDVISSTGRSDAGFTEDRFVQQLKVYNNINNRPSLIKHFVFHHSYYTNTANSVLKYRLRLDSIKEMAVNGTVTQPAWSFGYYDGGLMPDITTNGIDHWGFYNGAGNTSLVPNVKYGTVNVGKGANREPNENAAKFGCLERIKYPAGGFTTFEYEANMSAERKIGGVRIKAMRDYAIDKATTKVFEYQGGVTSRQFPKYDRETGYIDYSVSIEQPQIATYGKFTVSAGSIWGLGTLQGSHIGYSLVTEYLLDENTHQPLGKTVYQFRTGNLNAEDDVTAGDLEKKSVYDNAGKLLEETTNTYSYTSTESLNGLRTLYSSSQSSKTLYCKRIDANGIISYTRYGAAESPVNCVALRSYMADYQSDLFQLRCEAKDLVQTDFKALDKLSGKYLTRTVKYTYTTKHTLPILTAQYTTGGESILTRKKYAGDYIIPANADPVAKGIRLLQSKNMHTAAIEVMRFRQNSDSTNIRYLDAAYTVYSPGLPVPVADFRLETNAPFGTMQASGISAAGVFTADTRYKPFTAYRYNSTGNLVEQKKVNDYPTAYIWDYQSLLPVAAVSNADTATIAYTSFETDSNKDSHWIISAGTINTSTAFTGVRAYNLISGAQISKVNATAINKTLILTYWSKSGAIDVTQNGVAIALKSTGPILNGWRCFRHILPPGTLQIRLTATNAIIDELRLYPEEAQMQTYTYLPFIGTKDIVAANDLLTSYEYDGLSRLTNIRNYKGEILQNYIYNYGPGIPLTAPAITLYYNAAAEKEFTRNACPNGEPGKLTYQVSYGTYTSAISQVDADAKATADITANGQSYVNMNGPCWFYNDSISGIFKKQDCARDNPGLNYTYIVPARKHRSAISKAAADAMALEDLNMNGFDEAQLHGHCFCEGPFTKVINGICEKGVKQYTGTINEGYKKWKCTFVYRWSDGTYTAPLVEYQPEPCPVL
ncbi:DUF5977 domain-containing protein [Chitinophaga nivalis]|uniref:DUF5977 domain-containing protein n=1 Tax=Chitinophaga nivalis TaxID=2991709 RepID=A0ABT3IIU5_9BACT|nr:DUF5977 domain-containing protein [Chitinophaga nivalis]MCW3466428.1 DUF5977 domain-containing protein [Chitinophaga nivalis]MCW3483881.1 DUF5977 domain-containing protein [Chitinophaga nivalis]